MKSDYWDGAEKQQFKIRILCGIIIEGKGIARSEAKVSETSKERCTAASNHSTSNLAEFATVRDDKDKCPPLSANGIPRHLHSEGSGPAINE